MPTRQVSSPLEYATTTDGVSVAFTAEGNGPPLVLPAMGPLRTLQIERRIKSWRDWYGELARTSKVVRYDGRGTGLSSVPVDFGLSARLADLEAVTDVLGAPVFDLMAIRPSGPAAIAYTVRHPERVGHLILWCTYDRGTEYFGAPNALNFFAGIEADWAGYIETVVRDRLGATGALAEHVTATLRSTFSRNVQRRFATQGLAHRRVGNTRPGPSAYPGSAPFAAAISLNRRRHANERQDTPSPLRSPRRKLRGSVYRGGRLGGDCQPFSRSTH